MNFTEYADDATMKFKAMSIGSDDGGVSLQAEGYTCASKLMEALPAAASWRRSARSSNRFSNNKVGSLRQCAVGPVATTGCDGGAQVVPE